MMVTCSVLLGVRAWLPPLWLLPTCIQLELLAFSHCLPGTELTHHQEEVAISMQGRYWEESCLHTTALDVFL